MKGLFFLLDLVILGALLGLLVMMFMKARRAKASQDRLVQSLQGDDAANWFRVKLARPPYFRRRMKLIGFEASGVLVNAAGHVRLIAEFGGEGFDVAYPKDTLQLQWIGNPGLASSNMHWIALGPADAHVMVSADTGFNAVQSREATADICRRILPSFRLPESARADFALEKNKASLAVIAVFFALLAFALLDGVFLNRYELIRIGHMIWLLPGLMLFAMPAYFWLVRQRVPSRESLSLSILLALALMIAYLPAIKRADQILAAYGAQGYDYMLEGGARLSAVTTDAPTLHFSGAKEYWAQFEPGSVHRLELIHGPLGLWQLDRRGLNIKMRAFYQAYNDREKKNEEK